MFTGLIEALGTVQAIHPDGPGRLLQIAEPRIAPELSLGESVAINGVCLTIVARDRETFNFQVGPETLRLTNLGDLQPQMQVNLERSLQVGARMGGHIVQGHVDGLGRIERLDQQGEWEMIWFSCSPDLTLQMVPKGSVAIDGIRLTLVNVTETGFSVALIPHTLAVTTLGFKKPGATVNLETDLFAKYIAKYFDRQKEKGPAQV